MNYLSTGLAVLVGVFAILYFNSLEKIDKKDFQISELRLSIELQNALVNQFRVNESKLREEVERKSSELSKKVNKINTPKYTQVKKEQKESEAAISACDTFVVELVEVFYE